MEYESADNKVKELDEMMGTSMSIDTSMTSGGSDMTTGGSGLTTQKESNWDSLSPAGLADSTAAESKAQLGASLS